MPETRWSKKTDKIEVRLAPETKQAFHETCDREGRSASEVIRHLIEDFVLRMRGKTAKAAPPRRLPVWSRWGAAAVLGSAAAAFAFLPSNAESRWAEDFARMDADGDGRLATSEYVQDHAASPVAGFWQQEFAAIDADADGIVTLTEYDAHMAARLGDYFTRLDADGNGSLSFAEYTAPGTPDASAFVAGTAFGAAARDDADIPDPSGGTGFAFRVGEVFGRLDADADGAISREEFLAG